MELLVRPGWTSHATAISTLEYYPFSGGAKRAGRPYVPVQIVRPGISQYIPDEEFYQRLHRGEIIGAEGYESTAQHSR